VPAPFLARLILAQACPAGTRTSLLLMPRDDEDAGGGKGACERTALSQRTGQPLVGDIERSEPTSGLDVQSVWIVGSGRKARTVATCPVSSSILMPLRLASRGIKGCRPLVGAAGGHRRHPTAASVSRGQLTHSCALTLTAALLRILSVSQAERGGIRTQRPRRVHSILKYGKYGNDQIVPRLTGDSSGRVHGRKSS
jgi:hypothetical protein